MQYTLDVIEAQVRARARALIHESGVGVAARTLGVSREAVLALAADAKVRRGTIALASRLVHT